MIDPEEDEPKGFVERYKGAIFALFAVVIIGGVAAWIFLPKEMPKAKKSSTISMVNLMPPPPPPPKPTPVPTPPPPRDDPPPEPNAPMMEQAPVMEQAAPEAPSDDPPSEVLGTGIVGDGPGDGFGLGSRGSGFGGARTGSSGGAGSKYGRYALGVQNRIADALRRHPKTKSAELRIEVRVWADSTGRIDRVQLSGSSGDAALDAAIKNEILSGLRLTEPPPSDMPMPIVLRLNAKRPN